jgi:hypothetical protein
MSLSSPSETPRAEAGDASCSHSYYHSLAERGVSKVGDAGYVTDSLSILMETLIEIFTYGDAYKDIAVYYVCIRMVVFRKELLRIHITPYVY